MSVLDKDTKVLLIGIHLADDPKENLHSSLTEMENLLSTLALPIAQVETQNLPSLQSKALLGKGKVATLKQTIEDKQITLAVFDREVSPKQSQFLEKQWDCMVWDRTQLILEIFTQHANSPEAKAQVELARLRYMMPRLVGMWAHLDRETGGGRISRGMGEKQINIDRNLIGRRIVKLLSILKKSRQNKETQAKQRNQHCFNVSFVGYTNAGKSSLVSALSQKELLIEDKLFATLDSSTRILPGNHTPPILLSDTVGFIKNLPHELIASFRSTLASVQNADLLVLVVDASHDDFLQHIETTKQVLQEIEAESIPCITVYNKIDLLESNIELMILKKQVANSLFISTRDPDSLSEFTAYLTNESKKYFITDTYLLDYSKTDKLQLFYNLASVQKVNYTEDGITITYAISQKNQAILANRLAQANC